MRVLYAGTPRIAVPALDAVVRSRHELVGVLTAPDRQSGRGRAMRASPVKERAREIGVPVLQPERLGGDTRVELSMLEPDLLACFAYGKIFGPRFLALFRCGGLNVHPSLLPRHRGPAPIPAAILAGDVETGVTVQGIARETDAGDIYAQERIPLTGTETTESLTELCAAIGAQLLVQAISRIDDGTASPTPQDEGLATHTRLVRKEDGLVDWTLPSESIDRMVRAYTPWPRAYTSFRGETLSILESAPASNVPDGSGAGDAVPGQVLRVDTSLGILVQTGSGRLALRRLQLQSRKPLDWRSFLNGVPDFIGAVLGGS